MFRRKTNLPPRPICPTSTQMIEDLSVVTKDDPLFTIVKEILKNKNKKNCSKDTNDLYENLQKLYSSEEHLQEVLKNLNITSKCIKEKEHDLVQMSEDLKRKTDHALVFKMDSLELKS